MREYNATLPVPFGVLGIRCRGNVLERIDFLPATTPIKPAAEPLALRVSQQLLGYVNDPDFRFDLPLALDGTAHQMKVWDAMSRIPRGEVATYGQIAESIGSSARAVGRACGDNPLPIIVPCHRVVARSGAGGFMHRSDSDALAVKHWLLMHERRLP